jgi:GT2 family glycosyltransferase
VSHETVNRWRRQGWRSAKDEPRHPLEAARDHLDDAVPLLTGNSMNTAASVAGGPSSLSVSVVIPTDGRRANLRLLLESLRYLKEPAPAFEVCVVSGPTPDGTRDLLASWPDPIKCATVDVTNSSLARNRGIELAAGDIVAFLDDDALPEAEWLEEIVAGYRNDRVGGVGGYVLFDRAGRDYHWRFGTVDRLGRADQSWMRPATEFNFPYSYNVPHLLGTNCTFRRKALIEIGGWDEEFEYHLEETDVECRLIDAGWSIEQLGGARVYHKYAASRFRTEARIIKSWYSFLKNKLYFGLMHRAGYHTVREVLQEFERYRQEHRSMCESAVSAGHLTASDLQRFEDEAEQALLDGLKRGMAGERKLMTVERRAKNPPAFLPYRSRPSCRIAVASAS